MISTRPLAIWSMALRVNLFLRRNNNHLERLRCIAGPGTGDWAFFPENLSGIMAGLGYTVYTQNLGWAFVNTTGTRPTF
jgi:hypothetical protein